MERRGRILASGDPARKPRNASPTTEGVLMRREDVPSARIDEMFGLMRRYFEHVARPRFEADLAEKHWVILLVDPQTKALHGFSTQMLLPVDVDGAPVKVLFSGDTIVARQRWGQTALARTWARLALSLIDRDAREPLYWFLMSKGYKTYRFLPLFFREYHPRLDMPTPAWAKRILDAVGRRKFPDTYDADAGVVRAGPDKDRLKPGVADLTAERLRDPHARFFAQRNPGHALGEELCCLARLARDNITAAARRIIDAEASPSGDPT